MRRREAPLARASAARLYSSAEAWLPRPEGPFAENWGEQLTRDFDLSKCNSVIDLLQVNFDLKRKKSVGKKHLIIRVTGQQTELSPK